MASVDLTQAVTEYLQRLTSWLSPARGPIGYGLYINNHDGVFAFDVEPIVAEQHLANSASELTTVLTGVENSGEWDVSVLDISTQRRHTYDGTTWTTATVNLDVYLKPGRTYYSPYIRKVFTVDTTGKTYQLVAR